jgi:LuxR family maltose regulon positive regulatory protein
LTSFHGNARYLVDFLSEEVLSRQPEDVRRFLLRSSILDVLSGPLCESVVEPGAQPGYGSSMLGKLEHGHLFLTPLDSQHEWYRYHPLFEDFLRHEQQMTLAEETPLLHKRAAAWFEGHGDLNEAFKHALSSRDDQYAADLIERNVEPLIKAGELPVLTRWIGKLKEEEIRKRPLVSLAYAWSSMAAFQLDNARRWLDDLQRSIEEQPTGQTSAESYKTNDLWNIAGGLAICRSTLALLSGDAQAAADFSKEAAKHLKGENPFMQSMISLEGSLYGTFSGDTSKAIETLQETVRLARLANNLLALVHSLCRLAEMQSVQGHLSQALVTLQKAHFAAIGPDSTPLPVMGLVDIELGKTLYERDLLDEARECLERGIRLTQSWLSRETFDGMISLARVLASQGNYGEAQARIGEASQMALSTGSKWNEAVAEATSLRLALKQNDLAAAAKELEKINQRTKTIQPPLESGTYSVYEFLQLSLARYHLTSGKAAEDASHLHQAMQILDSLLPQAEKFQRVAPTIEILVLQALAQHALGEMDRAVSVLIQALALGEVEDYRRIFLNEGESMARLLVRCRQARQSSRTQLPSSGYIQSLLETIQPGGGAPWAPQEAVLEGASATMEDGLPVSLSARELQVLSLIAEGKSNQEISAELYLALNTVKRHAYNIYAKLEVKKRTQAVSKARRLGLIR